MIYPVKCEQCGLKKSHNPHPNAGLARYIDEVGDVYECIPCLVKSRNKWAARAVSDEKMLDNVKTRRS